MRASRQRFVLISPHAPEECSVRLTKAIDRGVFVADWNRAKPVLDYANPDRFRIHKRIGYGNSFKTFLSGVLRDDPAGTRIEGAFAMHPFTLGFMAFWFGGVGLSQAAVLWQVVNNVAGAPAAQQWLKALFPLGLALFGVVLVAFGRRLARGEAEFLKQFLIQTLDAREDNESL